MRWAALGAIGAYKRYLSPYKGFCCAYREHTGRASCSTLGARVIRRHGVFAGLTLLRQRTRRCGSVHRQCRTDASRPRAAQRGDCDLGGCDLGGCDLPDLACDSCNCGDCGGSDTKESKRGDKKTRGPGT